jgi:hypothetical protein
MNQQGQTPMTIAVGETERSELKAAVARARAHPVPWEVLKRRITEQDGTNTAHVEGKPLAHEPAEFVDLPFGYVVAISFEEQPAGICLHVSVSGPWPKVAPNMMVCAMIFNALDVPNDAEDVWTEELLIEGRPNGRVLRGSSSRRSPPAARLCSKQCAASRRASGASLPLVDPTHPRNRRRRAPAFNDAPRRFPLIFTP